MEIVRYVLVSPDDVEGDYEYDRYDEAVRDAGRLGTSVDARRRLHLAAQHPGDDPVTIETATTPEGAIILTNTATGDCWVLYAAGVVDTEGRVWPEHDPREETP
jgi:hypothetical protein